MTPELNSRIAVWRDKAANGTLTEADMREAIIAIRETRYSASITSERSKAKKAPAPTINPDDLLGDLLKS